MFRANVCTFLARFCISNFSLSVLCKSGFGFLWSGFPFQKPVRLLRVNSVILSFQMSFLALLGCILRRCIFQVVFSDRRFETAPDLSFLKHVKLVLAKRQLTSNQSFRFGN